MRLSCHTYNMNIVIVHVLGNKEPYIIKSCINLPELSCKFCYTIIIEIKLIYSDWPDIEHNFCECESVYLNGWCNVWFGAHDSNIIAFKNKLSTLYFHIEKTFFTRKKCVVNEYAIFFFCFIYIIISWTYIQCCVHQYFV